MTNTPSHPIDLMCNATMYTGEDDIYVVVYLPNNRRLYIEVDTTKHEIDAVIADKDTHEITQLRLPEGV